MQATEKDLKLLQKHYEGRSLYQGELHDHAQTGGTSDGGRPLSHWIGAMEALEMDFAAILDHRQVRHMYLPEWEDGLFIGGTEPGTTIVDEKGNVIGSLHYNMIFPGPAELESLLAQFPEYEFTGGPEGHFIYPNFTPARFGELMDAVRALGGFFVIPHPKLLPYSANPLDFWFRDETGIEVIYIALDTEDTKQSYELWTELLKAGKRVWACSGGDKHNCAHNWALTGIYAEEKTNTSYISHLRKGDFTAGSVALQMCIGDTPMGGKCSFSGQRLVIGVDKFHSSVKNPEHKYRIDVLSDKGLIYSQEISCEEPTYLAMDANDDLFYRAEIFDVTRNLRLAVGNPIWNER